MKYVWTVYDINIGWVQWGGTMWNLVFTQRSFQEFCFIYIIFSSKEKTPHELVFFFFLLQKVDGKSIALNWTTKCCEFELTERGNCKVRSLDLKHPGQNSHCNTVTSGAHIPSFCANEQNSFYLCNRFVGGEMLNEKGTQSCWKIELSSVWLYDVMPLHCAMDLK